MQSLFRHTRATCEKFRAYCFPVPQHQVSPPYSLLLKKWASFLVPDSPRGGEYPPHFFFLLGEVEILGTRSQSFIAFARFIDVAEPAGLASSEFIAGAQQLTAGANAVSCSTPRRGVRSALERQIRPLSRQIWPSLTSVPSLEDCRSLQGRLGLTGGRSA